MKVSSPIGELPFTPKKLRLRGKAIEMEGVMGAWPARVQVTLADVPSLLRVLLVPILVTVVLVAVVVVVVVAIAVQS